MSKAPKRAPRSSAKASGDDTLSGLLQQLTKTAKAKGPQVELAEILEVIGERAFGPWLMLVGLVGLSPLAILPAVPTLLAVLTLLTSVQVLAGRRSIWLPRQLTGLSIKATRLKAVAQRMETVARVVDRIVRPRLRVLTTALAHRLIAAVCVVVALVIPPLELVPFAGTAPAAALTAFGLGLSARDGLLVLLSLLLSLATLGLGAHALLT